MVIAVVNTFCFVLKGLNIRHDTIKLLEGSMGKTFSDINCTDVFLGQSPKVIEIKTKINKWDLIELTNFCTAKETIKNLKKKKRKDSLWNGRKYLPKMRQGFPGGAVVESLPANAGDTGLSPGLGGSHMPQSS